MIPFLDVRAANAELKEDIANAIDRVVASGRYIKGPEVAAFEAEFAQFVGARHCVSVGSGLDALYLALKALGVGPGDEVIVPSNTFIATWLAVSHCGATPVPVEPDIATHNIDPVLIERAISPKTKAIIPVHLYGQPADLEAVRAIADRHGVPVLEDAAQAHGARFKGTRIGSHGVAAAWSFYPAKNLGAIGDGGALTTNDTELAEKVRRLGNYGSTRKYHHAELGYNSRLDEIQAAILRIKLRRLDDWNLRRQSIAAFYRDRLATADLVLPKTPDWASPVWHLFVVRHARRDAFQAALAKAGVETLIHYPVPPHRQEAYRGNAAFDLPNADLLAEQVLSLPIGPQQTAEASERVVEAILAGAALTGGTSMAEPGTDPGKPIATFVVIAYNQEKYVAEAVRSALAQTYEPIRFLFSDDCSTDGTFDVMRREVERCGKDRNIVVRRNETNLGLAEHLNAVFSLASGTFVVLAAGDDVSHEQKAEKLIEPMLGDPSVIGVHSALVEIDGAGAELRVRDHDYGDSLDSVANAVKQAARIVSQSHAFRRAMWDRFAPMDSTVTHEGYVLTIRELLLGKIVYVPVPLTYYRLGGISHLDLG